MPTDLRRQRLLVGRVRSTTKGKIMANLPEKKLEEIKDPAHIKTRTFDASQNANFKNNCGVTVYIHIQWPHGGIVNFELHPGETHSLYIGTGGNPCGCYSTLGVITDCGDKCGTIEGGSTYITC